MRGRWATGATLVAVFMACAPVGVHADVDSDLFALTNQDRASNGVPSLQYNGTLQSIAENGVYSGCGFSVNGRAEDMIERNYFSHTILGCDQLVFSMMQAYGVDYSFAGENVGWETGSSATYINDQFMNSPEHRSNILDSRFTDLGVGSWSSSGEWSGAGSPYSNVWMFAVEFAQIAAALPPPPAPEPEQTTPPQEPTAAPEQPPSATAAPTPAPPTTAPTPTPSPELPPPPLIWQSEGLVSDSVESVLESYM